jgi:hypothetical protein
MSWWASIRELPARLRRHCEERSDEAIQFLASGLLRPEELALPILQGSQ